MLNNIYFNYNEVCLSYDERSARYESGAENEQLYAKVWGFILN